MCGSLVRSLCWNILVWFKAESVGRISEPVSINSHFITADRAVFIAWFCDFSGNIAEGNAGCHSISCTRGHLEKKRFRQFFFYFLIFFLKCFVKQTWIMKSFLGMLHNVMLMLGMERGGEKPVVHVCLYLEIKKKMKYMES